MTYVEPTKYLEADKVFEVFIPFKRGSKKGSIKVVRPVNGETHFNDLGFSAGFVHFADPLTGEKLGFCGVCYFEEHAKEVI